MDDYNKQALKAVDLQKKNKSHEAKKIYMHPLVNDHTISMIPSGLNKYFDYLGVQLNKLSF